MAKGKKKRNKKYAASKRGGAGDLKVFEYSVTTEPVEDRYYKKLPEQVKDEIDWYHDMAQKRPDAKTIAGLEALIEKYPRVPLLYNYLSVAYARSGNREKAKKTVKKSYQMNPDYLFARLNYAEIFIARGDYKKVAEIFDYKFDLKMLYPKRQTFHISEVTNFMGLIGVYFLKTGEREMAERYYKLLLEIDDDHPMTKRLRKQLYPGFFRRLFRAHLK